MKRLIKLMNKVSITEPEGLSAARIEEINDICMTLGATYPSSYTDAYYKIKRYAAHILNDDSMQTTEAKKYWKQKQDMVKSFLEELEFDLIF